MPTMQRTHAPDPGVVMFVMPFGIKNGFDYDRFYNEILKVTIEKIGLKAERVDSIYGEQKMLDIIWRSIQRAEILVADFSGRSVNVGLEVGWAMLLGKRIITIAQGPEDIPTDLRGLNRYLVYPTSLNWMEVETLKDEMVHHLEALRNEPVEEMTLIPYAGYGIAKVRAKVIDVSQEYATVRTDDGSLGYLTGSEIDYTRVYTDVSKRLHVGDQLDGAFVLDPRTTRSKYTLLLQEDNPWSAIASTRQVGTTFTSVVTNVIDVGVFVRVLGRINGLIPRSAFAAGAELPAPGAEIDVVVLRLDIDARKVGLAPAHTDWTKSGNRAIGARPATRGKGNQSYPEVGAEFDGHVARVAPSVDGRGGFVLVKLPGFERPAMLHVTDMTEELADEFESGKIAAGAWIGVRVKSVDPEKNKVLLEDLEDDEAPIRDADAPVEVAPTA